MPTTNKPKLVSCPACGRQIQLRLIPAKPGRLVAICSCGRPASYARAVLETDDAEPATLPAAPADEKKGDNA